MPRHPETPLSPQTILWLQTTSGNRAVQRLLARKAKERHKEEQLMVVSAEPQQQQLEIPPATQALAVIEHRTWWQWILRLFFKRRFRLTQGNAKDDRM
jgi:hypothetical protein